MPSVQPEIQTTSGGVGLTDYLGVFTRRIWLILIPFVLVLGIAGALGFLLPPKFQAMTRVKVQDLKFLERFHNRGGFDIPYKPFLTTIQADIKSRRFLEDLVRQYGISEGYDYNNPRERQKLFREVISNLKVAYNENKNGPDIFGILYQGRDAKRVARFVNGIRNKYLEDISRRIIGFAASAKGSYVERFEDAKREVQQATQALRVFEARSDAKLAGEQALSDRQRAVNDLEQTLETTRNDLDAKERELDFLVNEKRGAKDVTITETQTVNPEYTAAYAQVELKEKALEQLSAKYTRNHPAVQNAMRELEEARDQLSGVKKFTPTERKSELNPHFAELNLRTINLQSEIQGLRSRVEKQTLRLAALLEEVREIPALREDYVNLQTAVDSAVLNQQKAAELRAEAEATYKRVTANDQGVFQVLKAPTVDEANTWDPVFPKVGLFLGAGALIGLLLGAALAFIVEFSNQSFVTAHQVRRLLPVPLLGQVEAIRTAREKRSMLRRRVIIGGLLALIIGVLIWVHVAYFSRELQEKLPPQVFDIMKRIYGSR